MSDQRTNSAAAEKRLGSANYHASEDARRELRTARRRIARGEERVRRWEALLADPGEMARRDPEDVLRGRDGALKFTREWLEKADEIRDRIERLKGRQRFTYCESSVYRERMRAKARGSQPD